MSKWLIQSYYNFSHSYLYTPFTYSNKVLYLLRNRVAHNIVMPSKVDQTDINTISKMREIEA